MTKKPKELRQMSVAELTAAALEQKREQFNLRMAKAQGQLNQTHEIRTARRALARLNTIMAEKSKAGEA